MSSEFDSPLVISVAPNGARKTQKDHAALPITPAEIASTAVACVEAGASLIHLHVRDDADAHSLDGDRYRAAIAAVEASVGDQIVIQMTTEAVGRYTRQEQAAAVREVCPPAASLAIRELCPDEEAVSEASEFFQWMRREEVHAQFILYAPEDVTWFWNLHQRGIIPWDRPAVLYVLGRYSKDLTSKPTDLPPFLHAAAEAQKSADSSCDWSVCAFGPLEGACAITAAALDGHARVGFENNLYLADGTLAPDNAALVAQVADGAHLLNRPIADAAMTRRNWGITR